MEPGHQNAPSHLGSIILILVQLYEMLEYNFQRVIRIYSEAPNSILYVRPDFVQYLDYFCQNGRSCCLGAINDVRTTST